MNWLGGLDSNQDNQIQSLMPYRLNDLPAAGGKEKAALEALATASSASAAVPARGSPEAGVPRFALFVAAGALMMVGVLVGVARLGWIKGFGRSAGLPKIGSIAVFPLENLSGDPEQDYFVDGMSDALVIRLAQIGALRVISRTSAMRYRGTHKPLPEMARELNADAVIEGAVTRSANRVRITVQLIHAAADRRLQSSPDTAIHRRGVPSVRRGPAGTSD